MTKPRVLNKRHKHGSTNFVYVARPSKWGNPFTHLKSDIAQYKVKNRQEAIDKYKEYLLQAIEEEPKILEHIKQELRGKDLVCWCAPSPCHADILLKLANS